MSIRITFDGASTNRPGVYPTVKVLNLTGFPLQPTGVVGIVGEAIGGEPGVLDILEGAQIQSAKLRYKSGPIADALGILVGPSKDPRVKNGASKIVVFKTNNGTQGSKNLLNNAGSPTAMVNLKTKNWGADENNVSAKLTAGAVLDAQPTVLGTIDGPFTLAGGETLIVKFGGTTYTFTNTLTGSTTAAAMIAEINTDARWAASRPVTASVNGLKVNIALRDTIAKLEYGYIYIDPTSTIDTIIGLTGYNRGVRGTRFPIFTKGAVVENVSEVGVDSVMTIKYLGTGTDCKFNIKKVGSDKMLTTVCTGASGDDLSIKLATLDAGEWVPKITVKELVDQIEANAAYDAAVTYPNPSVNAMELDYYDSLQIELVTASLKRDIEDLVGKLVVESVLVEGTKVDNVYGTLATITAAEYFTGATDGSSTNTTYSNGLDALKQTRVNRIVPLISENVGAVAIDTINALADAHAQWSWSAEGRSPRNAIVSKLCSKADFKVASKALNSGYTSIFGQDIKVFSQSRQDLAFISPWAAACLAAGMQSGAPVGEPITHKIVNINDLRVRDGSWNPRVDFAELIDAGCSIIEPIDAGGFRFLLGNTTYNSDPSFVWNRISVVDVAGFVYYDLLINLESIYTGTKAKTGSAESIANTVKARMGIYLAADITVGDDLNGGLGYYKDTLRVNVQGNTSSIDLTITPVQGIDFILPTIYLADIKQSA
jgi:hypothetical protein